MATTNNHSSSPSYLGDLTQFAFPSSENKAKAEETAITIERVGSIFIKSGMPKMLPFPSDNQTILKELGDSKVSNGSTFSAEEDIKSLNTVDTYKSTDEKGFKHSTIEELVAKRPSLRPINSVHSPNKANGLLRNNLLTKYKIENEKTELQEDEEGKLAKVNSIKNNVNLVKLNSLRSARSLRSMKSLRSIRNRGTISMHHANSIERSISPDLSKHVLQFNDIPENEVVHSASYSSLKQRIESIPDIENLQIPRRSPRRLLTKTSVSRASSKLSRSLSVSSKRSRLNGESLKSIQTLATEIKSNLHKKGFKSVDFTSLDILLQELMDLTEDNAEISSRKSQSRKGSGNRKISGQSNSKKNSIHRKQSSCSNLNNGSPETSRVSSLKLRTKHNDVASINTDVSEFKIVKPFEIKRNLSRRFSVKRNISMLSDEFQKVNRNSKETMDNEQQNKKCELKRSNAIKRRPRIIEMLINLIESLKSASKKIWVGITRSSKKVNFKKTKKKGVRNLEVSAPVLVDIHKTAFEGHNLYNSSVPRKTVPIMHAQGEVNKSVGIMETAGLSTVESNEYKLDGVEQDQLVLLWKHYLSNSIVNRVDMKMETANAVQLQRLKSVQSVKSKRKSIQILQKEEISRLLSQYVRSETSSSASSQSGPLSLTGFNSGSSSTFNTEEIERSFDAVLFGDTGSIAPTYSTFIDDHSKSTSSWSTVNTDTSYQTGSSTDSYSDTYSDSDTDRSSVSTIDEEDSEYYNRSKASTVSSHEEAKERFSLINGGKSIAASFQVTGLKYSPSMRNLHSFQSANEINHSGLPSRTSSMFSFQRSVY